ncbi:MAG TPA: peptidoglycan editing factor PgeF [Actinomycetales bacterium]|nr:peptidoglycan editing factor PgeF [Actinomycetales bacterium]
MLWFDARSADGSAVGFTNRAGGVSHASWSTLNLGAHVGDAPEHVTENRARLAAELGLDTERVLYMRQVHSATVVHATGPWPDAQAPPEADALVTDTPDLALVVLVADCVPVVLTSPEGVVGVAHAGRRGMDGGVVPAAVEAMKDLGARAVRAVLGPSICPRCYEVPEDLREDVATRHPLTASVTYTGTPALDVAAGVLAQLEGIADARQLPGCTAERDDLYSYRRDGVTGRFAGVARTRRGRA